MKHSKNWMRAVVALTVMAGTVTFLTLAPSKQMKKVYGSDHREAPTVDGLPEGDITDLYSFTDPNDSTRVVFIVNVNPFAEAAEGGGYAFSPEMLYQFKIDNTGDAREDQVIQIVFDQTGQTQTASVYGPAAPTTTGSRNTLLTSTPTTTAKFNALPTSTSGVIAYVGLRDDPFVFDFAQFTRILNGTQDLFRAVGSFRGRPVRSDGTSGVDTFAGFNVTSIAVSVPKTMLQGSSSTKINVWATVSKLVPTRHGQNTYDQFERMGQQAVSTIFVPSAQRDAFNFAIPENDVATYSGLIPDALTTTDNDGSGNTIAGRAALLQAQGVAALPERRSVVASGDLWQHQQGPSPDSAICRMCSDLDLSLPFGTLAIGQFGLQNGRPLDYSTIDVPLQLLRQLADVQFPAGVTGGGPAGTRAALNCTAFPQCQDRRVLVVLQGTQFIKPDNTITNYLDGNDYPFLATFPYIASPHPLPGAAGTIDYPTQQ